MTDRGIFPSLRDKFFGRKFEQGPRLRVVEYDPELIRDSRTRNIDKFSDFLFLGDSLPRPSDIEGYESRRVALRHIFANIVDGAISLKHTQSPIPWTDEGAGAQGKGPDKLDVIYQDGTSGSIAWNASDLLWRFPQTSVKADGKIRDILAESAPELGLDGPINENGTIFLPFPKVYNKPY